MDERPQGYYGKKPYLLVCPTANMRRGPNPMQEVRVSVEDATAVDYGGPTTACEFPFEDPEVLPNAVNKRIIASYGANCWIYNLPPGAADLQGRAAGNHLRKMHAARRPSDTPLMADAMWRGGGPDTAIGKASEMPTRNGQWSGSDYEFKHFAMRRHNKGIQLTFFDGSVHYQRARNLWQLYWHNSFDIN